MNLNYRILSADFICITKKIYSNPFGVVKSKVVAILRKLNLYNRPNLFDSKEFLLYVFKKKIGLENNLETINTLVLRGSNADYGFYSPIWENSYNLGLTSTDFYTNYYLYKNYRRKLKNLENIVLFYSVSVPGYSLVKTSERYRAVSYKYFFNIPYSSSNLIEPKYEKKIIKKCEKLKSVSIENNYSGYDKKSYYGTHISAENRVKTHLRENKREPDQIHWLKSLAEQITEDNRRLIIVIPPFRNDYKELLPEQSLLFEKLYNVEELNILNFYDSELFTDDDHGDTDHLNEKGAIKLTSEIMQIFKKNNWIYLIMAINVKNKISYGNLWSTLNKYSMHEECSLLLESNFLFC